MRASRAEAESRHPGILRWPTLARQSMQNWPDAGVPCEPPYMAMAGAVGSTISDELGLRSCPPWTGVAHVPATGPHLRNCRGLEVVDVQVREHGAAALLHVELNRHAAHR